LSLLHQDLVHAVHQAAAEARAILNVLEKAKHPPTGQTGQAASLFLALASIEARLLAVGQSAAPMDPFVRDLEQLVPECSGKLAPVERLIEEALRIARQDS
jgi:hypothetical protein